MPQQIWEPCQWSQNNPTKILPPVIPVDLSQLLFGNRDHEVSALQLLVGRWKSGYNRPSYLIMWEAGTIPVEPLNDSCQELQLSRQKDALLTAHLGCYGPPG